MAKVKGKECKMVALEYVEVKGVKRPIRVYEELENKVKHYVIPNEWSVYNQAYVFGKNSVIMENLEKAIEAAKTIWDIDVEKFNQKN